MSSSCNITCPFCELEFEATNIQIEDEEVNCKYCNQEFSVSFEHEITAEVTECTVGSEYEEKRKIGKKAKYEMYIIYLGLNKLKDVYYTIYAENSETSDYNKAKLFHSEESAKRYIKQRSMSTKYPKAKPIQFKECVAVENDAKEKGTGLFN